MRIATVCADCRKPLARSVNFSRFMLSPSLSTDQIVLRLCNTSQFVLFRHAGFIPASNPQRALPLEARWTSEQVRGDGRGGLLAFLPRLLRIRREQVPEIIALVPKRRGVAVGHRAGDAIIRLGEARAGLPVDLLAHVVAGVVVVARQEGFPRLLTAIAVAGGEERSEGRPVGEKWVSTGRYRWGP